MVIILTPMVFSWWLESQGLVFQSSHLLSTRSARGADLRLSFENFVQRSQQDATNVGINVSVGVSMGIPL